MLTAQQLLPTTLIQAVENNLREGIFYFTDDSVEYANTPFLKLTGFTSLQEMNILPLRAIFVDEKIIARLKIRVKRSKVIKDEKLEILRKNGTRCWVSLNLEWCRFNNRHCFVGTVMDITEQLKTERMLREKNEALKKVNDQMDRFLYSASHDIRQPLASILGLIQVSRMDNEAANLPTYLDRMEQSVEKLDVFLKEVLQFSRNSHERILSERCDVLSLVTMLFRKYENHPHAKFIKFELAANDAVPFYSDINRLEIVLDHIIYNAILYFDPTKANPFIRVSVQHSITRLTVEITDNGIGIARTHLDKVCDIFYRASQQSKGSGLGLYIVKETLLKLGGSILIDSEIGYGTIVNVDIPNGAKGRLISKKMNLLRA